MNVACTADDIKSDTTHQELHPTQILSVVASLTPFSNFNQSPRNMYQCQVCFLSFYLVFKLVVNKMNCLFVTATEHSFDLNIA